MVIFNTQGRLVVDRNVNEEKILIEKSTMKSGLYLFKLIPLEKGNVLMGKFIIE